jgi:hypothetical protein
MTPKTQDHSYIQCEANACTTWQIKLLTALRQQMETLHTNPNLQEAILHFIDSAMADRAISTTGPFHDALYTQSRIGWLSMLQGHWTQEWQKSQAMKIERQRTNGS